MSSGRTVESSIHIDTSQVPDHVRNQLAEASMNMVLGIIQKPGGRELLEVKKAEIAKRRHPCK